MNIVNYGNQYQIFGEDVSTSNSLPPLTYDVAFSQMKGFYLVKRENLEEKEEKIYGNSEKKADKVLSAFAQSNRNFGLILSGMKGAGKSLLARVIAQKAIKNNMPVIVVSEYIPGIANFLSSINQEVVVLFDEFEKTFSKSGDENAQVEMLPLFDGIDSGKKLFIITCNNTSDLSEYMLNRPGRFHYHFILKSPSSDEVKEYMLDKLKGDALKYVDQIVKMSLMNQLTFDCLRALVFDLNMGYSLTETLEDLNIHESINHFSFMAVYEDGTQFKKSIVLNLYSKDKINVCYQISNAFEVEFDFNTADMVYDNTSDCLIVDGSKVSSKYTDWNSDYGDKPIPKDVLQNWEKKPLKYVIIQKEFVSTKLLV